VRDVEVFNYVSGVEGRFVGVYADESGWLYEGLFQNNCINNSNGNGDT
jgi:hypothetical protein